MLKFLLFFWPYSICFLLVPQPGKILLFVCSWKKFYGNYDNFSTTCKVVWQHLHPLCRSALLLFVSSSSLLTNCLTIAVPKFYFWEHNSSLSFIFNENIAIIWYAFSQFFFLPFYDFFMPLLHSVLFLSFRK